MDPQFQAMLLAGLLAGVSALLLAGVTWLRLRIDRRPFRDVLSSAGQTPKRRSAC